MLVGMYILVDDEYGSPIYAEPPPSELDDGVWHQVCELVQDVLDGEQETRGTLQQGEMLIGWRSLLKTGITFVAVVSAGVRPQLIELYLQKLAKRYADEVDDWRSPDKAGVADVVIDVIPPWEEDDG